MRVLRQIITAIGGDNVRDRIPVLPVSKQPGLFQRLTAAVLVTLHFTATFLFAVESEMTDEPLELKRIIEAQQRQLEKQQQELDAQRKLLQELHQQILRLSDGDGQSPSAGDQPDRESVQTAAQRPVDSGASAKNKGRAEPNWPGSISLFGSKTRLAVGGFAELDVIYDTGAIDSPCQFITSAISTDGGTPAGGADGRTSFCVNTSRLTFETRTPTRLGRLKTFLSLDLFGDPFSTTPSLRMRQAYGELSGALWGGDLLFGQAWGTFVDLGAWPDILDFEGPNSAIAVRQPMIRWTRELSRSIDFQAALEQPGNGSVDGADSLTRWPDLVGTMKWKQGNSYVRGAGLLRDIRVSAEDSRAQTASGWGFAGSGKLALPSENNLVFEASYGKGAGGYYGDGPPNAVYNPLTSSLDLLPAFGYYVGFEHNWSRTLSSSGLYAALEVDNLESEPDDAFRKTAYFSLNLIWRPDTPLLFGVEFLRGGRQDKSGAKRDVNRIQLTSQFSF